MSACNYTIKRVMQRLCADIGARPTGSASNKDAVQYAAGIFRNLGFEVSLQEFPCMDWQNNGAALFVDGTSITAVAAEYSLPCSVSGRLVCASSIEELKAANLTDSICVLHGELAKEVLAPKGMVFWNPEEHKAIISELENKKPLAVITVSFLSNTPVSIIQDGDFTVPCAAVAGSVLDSLLKGGIAKLVNNTERRSSSAANIIARRGTGGRKAVFSAHIDTKPNTPGALDNAGGVAVLLALAEGMAQMQSACPVEFVLFNGEDYYSAPGELAYMNKYMQNPAEYAYAVNVDGVGMKDSKTSYSFYACSAELENRVHRIAAPFSEVEAIESWPMGDHMLFAGAGVPAVAVTSSGIFSVIDSVTHTQDDNLSQIDYNKLEQAAEFLLRFVVRARV